VAEKEKHADRVLLIRCGDFYEAYGLDALLLVEHAGLNPMGRKVRVGPKMGIALPPL
jgi:DNA mismatch repair ATPase MutS